MKSMENNGCLGAKGKPGSWESANRLTAKSEMLVCYMPLDNASAVAVAFGTSVRCNQL